MASELQLAYGQSGLTVYAVVRSATGTVWNGSSLVAFNGSNWADYDVAATEQGTSGYYVADMPAVAAGRYNVTFHRRVGGTPAQSDPVVGAGDILWSGSAVAPDVLDATLEAGYTVRQGLRLVAAAAAGRRTNSGTVNETFDAIGNSGTARIVSGLNASGDGTPTLTPGS